MRWLLLLPFAACAFISAAPAAVKISADMERCLTFREKDSPEWQCECVKIANERCAVAGLDKRCYADGWSDRDTHGFEIARCRARGYEDITHKEIY